MNIINIVKKTFYTIFLSFFLGFIGEQQLLSEGFLRGTQVKTPMGYMAIEQLRVNDVVMCCDDAWSFTERPVIAAYKKRDARYVKIMVGNQSIYAAVDQKFYVPTEQVWIEAQAIMPGDMVLSNRSTLVIVDDVINVDEEEDFYEITVDGYHNFCVSSRDIHVHNVIPVITAGFGWFAGLGAVEVAKAALAVAGAAVAFIASRNNDKQKAKISASSGFGGQNNNDSPPEDDDPDDKKQRRDETRNNHRPLTNKEARQKAQELGYKEDKNPPFDTHGKPAFRKGNDWISPDRDGHNGGVWKRFSREGRKGTYNIDLTKKIGT